MIQPPNTMKRFALFLSLSFGMALQAQNLPYTSITDIQYVSPANLAACNDTSAFLGDTVMTYGIVVTPGNVSEVASGSVQGGNRPFFFLVCQQVPGVFTARKDPVFWALARKGLEPTDVIAHIRTAVLKLIHDIARR